MRIFLIVFILLLSRTSYSCSCIPLGEIDDEQYNEYEAIFSGKVIAIKKKQWTKEVTFEIQIRFKGIQKLSQIVITTSAQEGTCGISPKVGEQWLIFAYRENEKLQTSLCTRTKSMNKKAWNYNKDELQKDIEFLNRKIRG
ncbi:hypothetical protein ESA94_13960 [Lacibacter luteus]|uniref:Tissue inhibitor of metalloproteinase n=1 Tax=Lacibacter luteus TaxID=2508719 RepID=A0A4Q1CGJ9_9BACT|nr:hypothetical protein [Lacibacter luteus]RXK59242.1 hypothetical protein ESA94_13960 [Lacibacter luteus]